jgi:hypothetical protein
MRSRSVLFLSLSLLLFVVQPVRSQIAANLLNQTGYNRIGSEFWASGGAGITERGLHAAAFANPALLSFSAPTVTLESGWRPKTDYMSGIGYDNSTLLPSYASVGMQFGPVSAEAGYTRSYDDHLRIENVVVTTQQQPDGPGQLFTIDYRTTVHTAFFSVGTVFPEGFSVGLTTGFDFVRYDADLPYSSVHATGTRLQLTAGAVVRPFESTSFGLTFHVAADDILRSTVDNNGSITPLDSAGQMPVAFAYPSYNAKTPSSIGIGGSFDALPWLALLGKVEYQDWSALGSSLNDVWQYHIGAVASPIPEAVFRAGFFTQRSSSAIMKEYFDEYFLTAGASWKVSQNLTASLAYVTSAPFQKKSVSVQNIYVGDSMQQSMLSGGLMYSW